MLCKKKKALKYATMTKSISSQSLGKKRIWPFFYALKASRAYSPLALDKTTFLLALPPTPTLAWLLVYSSLSSPKPRNKPFFARDLQQLLPSALRINCIRRGRPVTQPPEATISSPLSSCSKGERRAKLLSGSSSLSPGSVACFSASPPAPQLWRRRPRPLLSLPSLPLHGAVQKLDRHFGFEKV